MPGLPSGTVTFLFTDIEGSTRLWEEHPEAMRSALARHDELMRAAFEPFEGHVFKTIGDAFCAAFHTAPDALQAALTAQQALHSEVWPEPVTIKVRMALHTGAVESRDNDYFGQPLNRVARLLAAGHGGQVLLSLATQELVRDLLPDAVSLLVLGEHRLRDLSRSETVYQLLHPDLPTEFPALKSLDNTAFPNNLPRQVTSFIGREREMAQIKSLLSTTSLLTLTGSGGGGKTRLSLQVAADVLEQYPDGVWLVELAPLADPALVPQTVASALGLTEQAGKTFQQTVLDYLKFRRLLLVLDNCEHLLAACAQLCDSLLRACPHLTILTSSREGLGLLGEQTYRVPSLSLPDLRQPQTVVQVSQYEAVRLFIERAVNHKADFLVTSANAPALASVCYRLEGIPLAIELAAARVRSLSVEEINTRLDHRFRLLTGGSKMALPRQQTLRALIDWSYDLLSDTEKSLLCRLSVFSGGWTLEEAEQICSDAGETPIEVWEVLELLTSLLDKSLLLTDEASGATRYRMLETVRQYAQDRLTESGDAEVWRDRHLAHFLALAEAAAPHLIGREEKIWQGRLESEHDNLRTALARATEEGREPESALRICRALRYFWYGRGYFAEGRNWCRTALERDHRAVKTTSQAATVQCAGTLAYVQCDYAAARPLFEESLSISRELQDLRGVAQALNGLGLLACNQGDYDTARSFHEQSLAIRRELGDGWTISQSLNNLGVVEAAQGDYASGRSLLEESLSIRREMGIHRGTAIVLHSLSKVAFLEGNYAAAQSLLAESLSIRREVADLDGIAESLMSLGNVAYELGDFVRARSHYEESLSIWRALRVQEGLALLLDSFAVLAMAEAEILRSARLWGAAEALREQFGGSLWLGVQRRHEARIAASRAILGDDVRFDAAWQEGRTLTIEQAIASALEGRNQEA